ncbi:MAG: tRNA 2-thiouridine(34) synthase MnmA [Clostridia bacterium]|nr:tRNA 2-thiouridine(34) synthase MnmA [Clostridia bacterium]
MKKAIIAMSGGVDSSVAALLTQNAGYSCIGATMKLYDSDSLQNFSKTCCTADDAQDARAVAAKLGMPFYVFNYLKDFDEKVIAPFVHAYESGATPNPCIECNKYLKFECLFDKMKELSCEYIVTGHYARIEYDTHKNRYLLKKANDLSKDQSYVLYNLTQDKLAHILFPLGDVSDKSYTRKIALENGFINAHKSESQDICFVPDGDYVSFIERYTGKIYENGNFVDLQGNILGEHKGIIRYTVGQRKGLGLALPKPMYVCKKDLDANEVVLCYKEDLVTKEVIAEDVNLISVEKINEPMRVKARLRYNQKEQEATVYPLDDGKIKVVFDEPASTPAAKGQALVMYDGDIVVGGGTII